MPSPFQSIARLLTHRPRQSARVVKGLALLLVLGAGSPGMATVAPGGTASGVNAKYNGNGELVFIAYDSTAKVSYTLDLGLDMNSFFINGQQDAGGQQFFVIDDAQWQSFIGMADVSATRLRWSVLGIDVQGGLGPGGLRLFHTIEQGDEGMVREMENQSFQPNLSTGTAMSFFTAINTTGTHGASGVAPVYSENGSSVNADADTGNGYYANNSPGFNSTVTGNSKFDMSNAIGESSWFYYTTRSSISGAADKVSVDEFDNLGHDAYWGFTYVAPGTDSPYAGKYLLSYTMQSHAPTASTAAGLARMNFIDYAAGFTSRRVDAPLGEFAGYQISSLVVAGAVSAVPEPSSWALLGLGLGLGLIGWRARRRG